MNARVKELTLGARIDQLNEIREKIRVLESQAKELKESKSLLEDDILEQMSKEGITKSTGTTASVSVSTTVVPQVEDWDKFYTYILRQKAFHLLERRAASAAWREEVEARKGKHLPGVSPFTKTALNLRSL
jgi:hypothetical protein